MPSEKAWKEPGVEEAADGDDDDVVVVGDEEDCDEWDDGEVGGESFNKSRAFSIMSNMA
jgi:hypothetical protein